MRPGVLKAAAAAAFLILPGMTGCRFLEELLHMTPPEVADHAPGENEVCALPPEEICVTFSSPMDRTSCERGFSAFSDSRETYMEGRFVWEGETRLIFFPRVPLEKTDRITVRIDGTAEDIYGNSLGVPFRFSFSVGEPGTSLTVVATSPGDGEESVPLDTDISVEFSIPPDESSFAAAFSLYPVSPGYFSTSPDGRTVRFTPQEDLTPGTAYTVRIEKSLSGFDGGPKLARPHQFRFTTVTAPPAECEAAYLLAEDGEEFPLAPAPELTGGIEKDPRIRFVFSGAVPPSDRGNLIRTVPMTVWKETWDEEGSSLTASPESCLEYGTVYEVTARGAEYRLYVDGPRSRPPEIILLSCCVDDSAGNSPVPLELNDSLHFPTADSGFFDFHIRHAGGSGIDTGSFLEAFSLRTTNGCVTLETTGFEIDPEAPPPLDPAESAGIPPPDSGVTETVLRTRFRATDHSLPGTVTVIIDERLHDTYNNSLGEEYSLTVNH